jgi:hypothetical protein
MPNPGNCAVVFIGLINKNATNNVSGNTEKLIFIKWGDWE